MSLEQYRAHKVEQELKIERALDEKKQLLQIFKNLTLEQQNALIGPYKGGAEEVCPDS